MSGGFPLLERRFERQQWAISRLMRRDSTFRNVCENYEEAARAAEYWRDAPTRSAERADEYGALVSELEEEIVMRLRRDAGGPAEPVEPSR